MRLQISGVEASDAGDYKCQIQDDIKATATAHLDVRGNFFILTDMLILLSIVHFKCFLITFVFYLGAVKPTVPSDIPMANVTSTDIFILIFVFLLILHNRHSFGSVITF